LRGALGLALPLMVAMLATNLAFGVLAKAAPSLHPVQLGLPAAVLTRLFLRSVLAAEIVQPIQALFDTAFEAGMTLPGRCAASGKGLAGRPGHRPVAGGGAGTWPRTKTARKRPNSQPAEDSRRPPRKAMSPVPRSWARPRSSGPRWSH